MTRPSTGLPAAAVAVLLLTGGCGGEDNNEPAGTGRSGDATSTVPAAESTENTRCEVGEPPRYYVPKSEDSPLAIIGCARLGVSEKPTEFSVDPERLEGDDYLCVNPAYRGRGELGIYIPATCVSDPVPRRLDVTRIQIPRQAVRGYQLVIWGFADPSTRQIFARHRGTETTAALFHVGRPLARTVDAARPFSAFIVELPLEAACEPILLRAGGAAADNKTRIAARPNLCPSD
jgi:hypothetical protein